MPEEGQAGGRKTDQTVYKPGSVPPTLARRRDGHSSGPPVAGRFSRPTRVSGPATACPSCDARDTPIWSCSKRGLPCRSGYPSRGGLLPHPFTLALLRRGFGGRFAFCGAVPGVAPGGRYPPPCRRGARTFLASSPLARRRSATARPSDPRARWAGRAAASRGKSNTRRFPNPTWPRLPAHADRTRPLCVDPFGRAIRGREIPTRRRVSIASVEVGSARARIALQN